MVHATQDLAESIGGGGVAVVMVVVVESWRGIVQI